ncbi:hypothetical protein [Polyangium sp. y55x31]|uniref:hypothetical protein n=1 Tax=Polyangium sp. y55x31 TaxID=3042688 RepID=UPI002482A6CC|nr:hypothetical protein [Polyangium sp. y55x31]MDI1478911.1 hypothetical protein [Polyangium sp. y55x31]
MTALSLANRKREDIKRRLSALGEELDAWCKLSEPGEPFSTHHSQIRRLRGQLVGFRDVIAGRLTACADPLEAGGEIQQRSLEMHRIWEFFRSKLAQRTVPWYRNFLLATDELAWACYRPVRDLAVAAGHVPFGDVAEPPLVFLNGASSPLTFPRNRRYEAEPSLFREGIGAPELQSVLSRMPVPVIGLPWFEVAHLPDALLIGHEVGHVLEDFLNLSARLGSSLEDAFAKIPLERRQAYRAWCGEIFGDLTGTLATGPAFLDAMVHYLAQGKTFIQAEAQAAPFAIYPTRSLRVALCLVLLARMGFAADAARLRDAWRETYGDEHPMKDFEADLPAVVDALVGTPFPELGKKSLVDALAFSSTQHENASREASKILAGLQLQSADVRALFAAAGLAYGKNPKSYDENEGDDAVLGRILAVRSDLVRSDEEMRDLDAYDAAQAARLWERLAGP